MLNITNKKDCCGCYACYNVCIKNCISFSEDQEGFLYPQVDLSKCVNCNLCIKVCPVINSYEKRNPIKVYAAKNNDGNVLLESSSGGIFTLFAEKIIHEGGVVFGARFDDEWNVIHDYVENAQDISIFRGSKYVQSRVSDTYKKAEMFLKQGRKVLYSGTPCQIKGLKLYLRHEYSNLLTIDFICHGVPSPGIWRQYLNENFFSLKSAKKHLKLTSINFRNKKFGWKNFCLAIKGQYKNRLGYSLFSLFDKHSNNPYMKAFLEDLTLRPSCYNCPAREGKSQSDITLADFWGIWNIDSEFNDDKGTSAILFYSTKYCNYLESYSKSKQEPYSVVMKYNSPITNSPEIPDNRAVFFARINNGESISNVIETMLPKQSLIHKIIIKVKKIFSK